MEERPVGGGGTPIARWGGLVVAFLAAAVSPTRAASFPESEPNDDKAAANVVAALAAGDLITGLTTGSVSTPGDDSADYFRLTIAPATPGIYRHRLVLTSAGSGGHVGTIRGLAQSGGVVLAGTDVTIQASTPPTFSQRLNQWYGFGRGETLYYRLTGTPETTAPYVATLETESVLAVDLGAFASGTISITTLGQGHASDTDLWVYDAAFNALAGFGNDDESAAGGGSGATSQSLLIRDYAAGEYYLALSNANLANDQPSPPDDDFRDGPVLDFPDSAAGGSVAAGLNLALQIVDSNGSALSVAAVKSSAYDVLWFRFGVTDTPGGPDCNANGVPDDEDIAGGASQDCNANTIPDECDIDAGTSPDCNGNGLPDECELVVSPALDCDGDGVPDICVPPPDSDDDDVPDCADFCPADPAKTEPGQCGCDQPDTDSDGDGVADCVDGCPADPAKAAPGACGCSVEDLDTDLDGTPDCLDECPFDAAKTEPGLCGCDVPDADTDEDGVPDCEDQCPGPDVDSDGDGAADCVDECPDDPLKATPGFCDCGVPDVDTDGDGFPDCVDDCPTDPDMLHPSPCGCGVPDVDTDGDGAPDCIDDCPDDPTTTGPCVGRCCLESGACDSLTESDCLAAGGEYGGDGTLCDADTCPGPVVPACRGDMNRDGRVNGDDIPLFVECVFAGGTGLVCEPGDFTEDGFVTDADTPPFVLALLFGVDCGGGDPIGACLIYGFCVEIREVDCNEAFGLYLGDGSNCPCDDDSVDLGIDSNNNGFTFIDVEADDAIEDDAPGKFICVNDDDDNANGRADKDEDGATAGENDLVPILMATTCAGDDKQWRLTFPGRVKVWERSNRTGAVTSGELKDLPLPGVCYVEGFSDSAELGDVEIELTVEPSGGGAPIGRDKVRATVIRIDLDVDSDNSNAAPDFGPQRDADEDAVEDTPDRVGRPICLNVDDDDNDDITDLFDGFNLDRRNGTDDDRTPREDDFVRMVLELPAPVDAGVARIRLTYSTTQVRLWKRDGPLARRIGLPSNQGGDNLFVGVYAATALGLTNDRRSVDLWIEGTGISAAPGRARLRVELDPDGDGPAGFVCDDAVRATVVHAPITRRNGSDAGAFVPLFRLTPLIRVPNVPEAFDNGSVVSHELSADDCRVFDSISFVTKVEYSVSNFDGAATDGQWQDLAITDRDPPGTVGSPYESRFSAAFQLGGLDTLRARPLGSRRRYLFRATGAAGRTAYEELILEVRLNPTTREKFIFPLNLGPAPDAALPAIPDRLKHRLALTPVPPDDDTEVLTISTRLYSAAYPGGTLALKGSDLQQPLEFLFVDGSQFALRTSGPQTHFHPHVRVNNGDEIASRFKNASTCGRVRAVDFDLRPFLSDDSTEDVVPVSVRLNDTGVAVTQTNNFEGNSREYRFLMRPLRLEAPPLPESARPRRGSFRLEFAGANPGVTIWHRHFSGDDEPWFPLRMPFEHRFTSNPNSYTGLTEQQFAILGVTRDSLTTLRATFTYSDFGESPLTEDRVLLRVVTLPGLAGQSLGGEFPFIRFAHTFNLNNAAHIADTVSLALDPFQWPHLCGNYTLPTGNARPAARYAVVNHKSSAEWRDDNAFAGAHAVDDRLDGVSTRNNVKPAWANADAANDYDAVIDLADGIGNPGPNGRLDAGDIIGRLTPHQADSAEHRKNAEVHVVRDPGAHTEYAASAYAEYHGPYLDAGGGRLFVRMRGRVQYPVDAGAAWAATPIRRVGARGRNPNGDVTITALNYGGVPADFQGEYWSAVFDGTQWWLRSSVDRARDEGQSGAAVANVWTLNSRNGRVRLRITDGTTPYQQGDIVWFNVTRPPLAQGPYPLVVVAHGNHNHYIVSPPKYFRVTPGPGGFRHMPGAGGADDENMTIYDLREGNPGGSAFIISWDNANTRWNITIFPGMGLARHNFANVATGAEFDMPDHVMVPRPALPAVRVDTGGRFKFKIRANGPAVGTFGYVVVTSNTGNTPNENYRGHSYLLDHLARNGFVALSVSLDDHNAIDIDHTTGASGGGITERASIINQHFERFVTNPNGTDGIRRDLGLNDQIAFADPTLIGHSRGGEAVVRAVTVGGAGARYDNAQIISIAPTDALAVADTVLPIPYLVVYGSHDGDLSNGPAFRLYDRATGNKQLLHLRLANHNYFNESWPVSDLTGGAPDGFNGAANAAAARDQHRAVARSYFAAFLNANVRRTGINGANIPIRDYFAEFFTRSADSLRPPFIGADVVHAQHLGELGPASGRRRTDIENFQAAGHADRANQNFPAGGARRYRQYTWAGEFSWATRAPPTLKRFPVAATDFRPRDAVTLRIAQRQFRPETTGAGNTSSTPLSLTLQVVDGSTPPRHYYIHSGRLSSINVPVDRGAGRDLREQRGDLENKANYTTLRLPTSVLGLDGRALNLANIREISLILDQRDAGEVAIDDIGADH